MGEGDGRIAAHFSFFFFFWKLLYTLTPCIVFGIQGDGRIAPNLMGTGALLHIFIIHFPRYPLTDTHY